MATIAAPVGQRGANLPADVRTIQLLLNKVPAKVGGPTVALKPDGVAGPKTIGAIVAFQRAQFGPASADGRVDLVGLRGPGAAHAGRDADRDAAPRALEGVLHQLLE